MNHILPRWLVLSAAIGAVSYLMAGIHTDGIVPALLAAALLGLVNSYIRPLLLLLTLPLNVLTFGLFTFFLNAMILMIVSAVIPGFRVADLGSALLGALLISLVNWLLSALLLSGDERECE